MNRRFILLLTRDAQLEGLLRAALSDEEAFVRVARDAGDALQALCELPSKPEAAVIDFQDGCQGRTMLSALSVCEPELAVVAVTSSDSYRAASIAYASNVAACLTKPVSAGELRMVIEQLNEPKLQLACA